jgi:hypothetical protein
MRACFLGQNVCALGFGVAMVQTPPLEQTWEQPLQAPLSADRAAALPPMEMPRQNRMVRELQRRMVMAS